MAVAGTFNPALVVVDFQEDFCPPVSPSKTNLDLLQLTGAMTTRMALSQFLKVETLRLLSTTYCRYLSESK